MPADKRLDTPDHLPRQSKSSADQDLFGVRDVVASYNLAADDLVPDYERRCFEDVHAPVLDLIPESVGTVLDVGAGSGRDAAWFAAQGHDVIAVEPSAAMRESGKARHPSSRIRWMDDRLPGLDKVLRSRLAFNLVWLSAVWMHVPPRARARAFRKLVSVLNPGGSMMVNLRQGPPPPGRPMQPATAGEIEKLARRFGLQVVRVERLDDVYGRKGVSWEIVWLRLPRDLMALQRPVEP